MQCGFAPLTDVLPGHARSFSGHDAPGPPFDFSRPGGLALALILVVGIIETRQQLCGNVRTLVGGKRQCFAKKFLRSGGCGRHMPRIRLSRLLGTREPGEALGLHGKGKLARGGVLEHRPRWASSTRAARPLASSHASLLEQFAHGGEIKPRRSNPATQEQANQGRAMMPERTSTPGHQVQRQVRL